MGWTSYYVGAEKLKTCMAREVSKFACYNHKIKKSVQKGNKFYYLLENSKGEDWVLLMLGRKQKGEFFYKDIQCNPYESGVPSSILKVFKPSNDADKSWLEKQLKIIADEKANKKTFNIGDIVDCESSYDIEWGDGFKIPKGEKFKIIVSPHYTRTKVLKLYCIANQRTDGSFALSMHRLSSKTFKDLSNKELIKRKV